LRTKATRKAPQSLRYLLWVDNKLQRISMKKVALPLGKARARKPARATRGKAKASTRSEAPGEFQSAITSRASLVAIVVLSGAAILGMMGRARGPETPADVRLPAAAPVEAPALEARAAMPEVVSAPAPVKAPPPAEARSVAPAAIAPPPPAPPAPTPAVEVTPAEAVAPPNAPAAATDEPAAATTVTGCLAFDDGRYRLKDVTGSDAPQSRSWKSGFLRKRSATIDVRDADYSLGLANYVGKRVEATGTLLEREMQVRSLQRLADSCRQ
jgi:hypothetical protein